VLVIAADPVAVRHDPGSRAVALSLQLTGLAAVWSVGFSSLLLAAGGLVCRLRTKVIVAFLVGQLILNELLRTPPSSACGPCCSGWSCTSYWPRSPAWDG
jgi:hypothetical protein